MSGKKFIGVFLGLIVISAIGLVLWIKQGYDSRPAANVEGDKITELCAAASATVNKYIELDHQGKTIARSTEADALLDVASKTVPAFDGVDLTRDSVIAGCREVGPKEVEIVVSHAVFGSLAAGFTKDDIEKALKNDPKQAQSRVTVLHIDGVWKIDPSTIYGPHIGAESARAQAH